MNLETKPLIYKYIYIYIYIERERERERDEVQVTPFLDHWFVLDLKMKKTLIVMYLLFPRN